MTNEIKKEYVAVYDLVFYKTDEDGNEVLNKDGTIKLFDYEMDCSYLADDVDIDDLIERNKI